MRYKCEDCGRKVDIKNIHELRIESFNLTPFTQYMLCEDCNIKFEKAFDMYKWDFDCYKLTPRRRRWRKRR